MTRRAPTPGERKDAAMARFLGLFIAAVMILWIGAQWLGGQMGWEARYAFLFDMIAIAAFVWALVATWRIWRKRREN
ncbi:DUF5337 domain-containing protein [Cereibacter sp. SYSU M97828]|nr:DUF5337 domain-containing protein [Cereibacter flavus]